MLKFYRSVKRKIYSFSPLKARSFKFNKQEPPKIQAIILNWNRRHLLEKTVHSLLATAPKNLQLIIIDNGSTDDSPQWIKHWTNNSDRTTSILLEKNQGGEAFNKALKSIDGDFVLFSENDMEYLPGWWQNMFEVFKADSRIAQVSPLSPFPDQNNGEVWSIKSHQVKRFKDGRNVYYALGNVGTTSMIPAHLIHKGLEWESLKHQNLLLPADASFSHQIRSLGYDIAWSEISQVNNLGHNVEEWTKNSEYYSKNWQVKAENSIDGLEDLTKSNTIDKAYLLQEINSIKSRFRYLQRNTKDKELLKKVGSLPESTRLYLNTKNGFNSQEQIIESFNPYEGAFEIQFDLSMQRNLQAVRWDPIEEAYCRLSLDKITLIQQGGEHQEIPRAQLQWSKHQKYSKDIHFLTPDPQVIIPLKNYSNLRTLSIRGTLEILSDEA